MEKWQVTLHEANEKRDILRGKKIFVLDNSLRESTIGQVRGHTIENKWQIYHQIKKIGFTDMIVTSFNNMTQVGDTFIKQLHEKKEDFSKFYAFTELFESIDDQTQKIPITEGIPVGLKKMRELGIQNPIIEVDLFHSNIDCTIFTFESIKELLLKRLKWVRNNLCKDSKIFINFRDFPDAMLNAPERVLKVVRNLSSLPQDERPVGLMFEDSTGDFFPEQLGAWTSAVRQEMEKNGFHDGHLLVHVHEKWGLAETSQLECLAKGATGIWCGVCQEGADIGHACSSVTLMNLVRLGNENVLEQYNCVELRKVAQEVTRITTGYEPYPRQPVYGEQALDLVADCQSGNTNRAFCMAKFFGEEKVIRMTTQASPRMIVEKLRRYFGESDQFTDERAQRMLEVMLEDLNNNRKKDYMSKVGLAVLFDRSSRKSTQKQSDGNHG